MKAITLLASYIAGLFVVPFLLFRLPMNATKLPYFDNIWGNPKGLITDGLAEIPDALYVRYFPRFYWLALRNPSNALGIRYGLHGQITSMVKSKPNNHTRGFYTATARANGETGTFYYGVMKWPLLDRYFRYAFGPKIWSAYKVGDTIDSGYALSVLPFIEKNTAGLV